MSIETDTPYEKAKEATREALTEPVRVWHVLLIGFIGVAANHALQSHRDRSMREHVMPMMVDMFRKG